MHKIKSFLAVAITVIFLATPMVSARVDPGTGGSGGSTTTTTQSSPSNSGGGTISKSSDPCHPEWDKPPGNALTTSQLRNCEACNNHKSNASGCLKTNPIVHDIQLLVNALAGIIGVVCVAMIVFGGIRYSLARNNPNEVGAARKHIINAVVALIFFMLIWALLQYLIPGGVFNS